MRIYRKSRITRLEFDDAYNTEELMLKGSAFASTHSEMFALICMDKPFGKLKNGNDVKEQDRKQTTSVESLAEYYYGLMRAGGNILLCVTHTDSERWTSALKKAGFRMDLVPIAVIKDATETRGRTDRHSAADATINGWDMWLSGWKKADGIRRIFNVKVGVASFIIIICIYLIVRIAVCVTGAGEFSAG
jgi:hypothetical protein